MDEARAPRRGRHGLTAVAAALLLAACGGSGDGNPPTGATACDVPAQQAWLRSYMQDWYLWAGAAPDPDPAGYATLQAYFDARRFAGAAPVPADRWSYFQDSASYSQFFAEGKTMGYGLFVNGIELQLPLRVRMTEPLSPAATAGLQRGDIIVSANGRTAAELVAANDFSVFSPAAEGTRLALVIDRGGVQSNVQLTAATYTLTPVPTTQLLTLPNDAIAGYVVLKDFITQAEAPLAAALAGFRQAGATELIVDLRYNGGGRISTANAFASQIVGALNPGAVFTELSYNAAHTSSNSRFTLTAAPAPAFGRVVVLTGPRTCSASELLVNGLRPYAQVATIGGTSCGKPFGFSPVESCQNTFSVVNFQAYNAANQGDYYDGIAPTCAATDTFTGTPGDPAEALTAAASAYLTSGSCPTAGPAAAQRARTLAARARQGAEPGQRPGMVADR